MTPYLLLIAMSATADDRIDVAVDPRVELISIVCRLAGFPEYNQAPDSSWLKAVDAQFGPYRDHAAVKETKKLRGKYGISYDAPISLALHLDADTWQPRMPLSPMPRRLDSRWDGNHTEKYIAQLGQFARDARFADFLEREQETLDGIEARYRRWIGQLDVIDWFDEIFGPIEGVTYTLHPGLLTGPHNYGVSVRLDDESLEIRPVLGVDVMDERGMPAIADADPWVLVHEIAHAYVNPLFARHEAQLSVGGQAAYRKVATRMKATAYGSWETVANESGVRAATVLYARDHLGDIGVGPTASRDIARGFDWILPMAEALDTYRTEHSTGLEGFPAVAGKVLLEWSATEPQPPYLGPLNAFPKGKNTVMVLPNTTDDPASISAQMYTMSMHENFWAKEKVALVGADDSAGSGGKTRVYYGTPATNPPLAALLNRLDWRVEADGVSLGTQRLQGEHLSLIATTVDPEDGLPTQVYAAFDSEGIEGINSAFHGPTDWVVARRGPDGQFEVVDSGHFPKDLKGKWSNPIEVTDPPVSPDQE